MYKMTKNKTLYVRFYSLFFVSLFLLLFMSPTALFSTIMSLTILFQLTFTFIYNTFSKKISVSTK